MKDYIAEDLQNAFDKGREAGRRDDGDVCVTCGGIVFDPVLAQPEQEQSGFSAVKQ